MLDGVGGAGEGDLGQFVAWEEPCCVRIVPGDGLTRAPGGGVEHEHCATLVRRVGEHVDDLSDAHLYAGLLFRLAGSGETRVLPDVEVSAWHCPATTPWFHRAPDEKQAVVAKH